MSDDDLLKEAQEAFAECEAAERENRSAARDDIKFARLGEQWDEGLKAKRLREGRPCLTINKLPPFIRQVVNDARQNKPAIKVQPQDSFADPETAEIISGLIRNIEASSDADVAYDTALECAATSGVGYFRINLAYACDDSWDQDIVFERVGNPFNVYGDPASEAADSSDWNVAFVTEMMPKAAFKRRFPKAGEIDWTGRETFAAQWREGDQVMVAEYWKRTQVKRQIVLLSNGLVMGLDDYEKQPELAAQGHLPVGAPRDVLSHKVTQHLLNGVEVLDTVEWAGKFIPIVPVYGEEVNLDGKRYFRSLIRDAKDAQVMYNAWRTASTELVALAPKAPFIGPKGSFDHDADKWATANNASHAYIEYEGPTPPQRQPFAGPPAGALQEALNANDDIKAIIGLYDASLGARSNESSGRAILARQREGDVSTFHFIDNLSRAIRHAGRILVDLIPKVYGEERIVRILGQEPGQIGSAKTGSPDAAKASQQQQQLRQQAVAQNPQLEQQIPPVQRIYALAVGKYDLTVSAGPSFTTRREEAANQMIELMRANPAVAPVIGDLLAKNLDWPGADEIGRRLQAMLPPQIKGQDPQAAMLKQQAEQAIGALKQQLAQGAQRLQQLEGDRSLDQRKLEIEAFKAETDRMEAEAKIATDRAQAMADLVSAQNPQPPPAGFPPAEAA